MNPPRVAAVVLNYNGRDLTLAALANLKLMSYPSFDLVVVENGSTDGSESAIAVKHPDATLLRTERNLGVAGGYNLGITWALARDYDYVLALNNDIEVDPELLSELMRVAESDPQIGCVGPKAYYFWDRQRLWSAGGILRFKESVTRERGDGELDRGQYDRDQEVAYVNGNGMLMRRRAIEEAGLWDPLFHLSVEDADWCMRAKRRGWKIWYAHRAVLYHMVASATGIYRPGKTFQTGRSTALFVRRYGGPWQWLTFTCCALAAMPLAYLRELSRGNQAAVTAKIRGYLEGLRVPMTPPPAAPVSGKN